MDAKRPFYVPPSCILKTSADIIREARAAMAMRTVDTKRPFTPRNTDRRLFGSSKTAVSRPPSSFSLRQVQFHEVDQIKLPPLQTKSRSPSSATPWLREQKITSSLSNLAEDVEDELYKDPEPPPSLSIREIHSSPQERTNSFTDLDPLPKLKGQWPLSKTPLNKWTTPDRLRQSKKSKTLLRSFSYFNSSLDSYDIRSSPSIISENDEMGYKAIQSSLRLNKLYFKSPAIKPLEESNEMLSDDLLSEDSKIQEDNDTSVADPIPSLLDTINLLYQKGYTKEELIQMLERLYLSVRVEGHQKSKELQSNIIRTLYKFVEHSDDSLLLLISKIMLALRVSGQNFTSVAKLIFKVSRSDKNDTLFLDGDILEQFVESLGRASPLEDAEACIYGYGVVKFLTMNTQLLLITMKLGILDLMALHLKIVNNARLELLHIPENTNHALFQLTGALRNVASEEIAIKQFIDTGTIEQLCLSMELFSIDLDLVSNISRTLSIISTYSECCQRIIEQPHSLRTIVRILSKYPGRQDVIVRLGYALGNIVGKNETARCKLYQEPNAMSSLLNLLETYLDRDLEMMKTGASDGLQSPEWGSDGSVEDVIVKIVRIVANMSMHPDVGIGMTCLPMENYDSSTYAMDHKNAKDGGRFLDMLLMILRRKSIAESEELVMSTLTTLNNLSFYAEPSVSADGPFALRQIEITQVLCTLLLTKNQDSMVEVTRVLGNLTRSKDVRDYILEIGAISQLVRCLDSSNNELLFTTTGVLVNLMADWDKRLALKENNGVNRLILVLNKCGENDWRLASLICQALWNFCIDSTHLYAALGIEPTNSLLNVLVDLLDEERIFGIKEGAEIPETLADNPTYQSWEQFAIVATNLLEKIEQYLESLTTTEN